MVPRAPANTIFYLSVQEAGVYGFRTLWQNGGGGPGDRVVHGEFRNERAGERHGQWRLRFLPGHHHAHPPYAKCIAPSAVQRQVHDLSRSLVLVLSDATTALNDNSIVLKVDGTTVTPTKTRSGSSVTLTYTPAGLQFPGDRHWRS